MAREKINFTHVLWDWHGVLGLKGFWYTASKTDPEAAKLTSYIFDNEDNIKRWMRGDVTFEELVQESGSKVAASKLRKILEYELEQPGAINISLFSAVRGLYPRATHSLITDNADLFSDFAPSNYFLKDSFANIFNSADHGKLKEMSPGLFEHAQESLGLTSFDSCLLLDDNADNCNHFEQLGGKAILITRTNP